MREHQANIRIDKDLWTQFKSKAKRQESSATAEIIKFIEAYVQDDKTVLDEYPDLYIVREVKDAIDSNLDSKFYEAIKDYEKIIKHEVSKHYTELHQMYESRLRTIEQKLGLTYDPFEQKSYSDSPKGKSKTKADKSKA